MTAVNPLWGGVAGRERHVWAPREWAMKKWPYVSVMPFMQMGKLGPGQVKFIMSHRGQQDGNWNM